MRLNTPRRLTARVPALALVLVAALGLGACGADEPPPPDLSNTVACTRSQHDLENASPDGLPQRGTSTPADAIRAAAVQRSSLVERYGALQVTSTTRSGRVWFQDGAGEIQVESAPIGLLVVTVPDETACPPAPVFADGVLLEFDHPG